MKRVKLGKKYILLLQGETRNLVVNAMYKGKVVFLDTDNRSYFTFSTGEVKDLHKAGDLKGV